MFGWGCCWLPVPGKPCDCVCVTVLNGAATAPPRPGDFGLLLVRVRGGSADVRGWNGGKLSSFA